MVSKRLSKERNSEIEDTLKRIVLNEMKHNNDGYFVQDSTDSIRTLDKKTAEEAVSKADFSNALVHLRLVSSGAKTIANVHGWTIGDWQFVHNGAITDYVFYRNTQEFCDSFHFFKDLVHNITHYEATTDKQIKRVIADVLSSCNNFWGRALLYNKATDKAFLFGDWHSYLVKNDYLVYSSCDLKFSQKSEKKIKAHGMVFEAEVPTDIHEQKFEGLVLIENFSKPNFFHKQLADDEFAGWNYKASHTVYTVCEDLLAEMAKDKDKTTEPISGTAYKKPDQYKVSDFEEWNDDSIDYLIDDAGAQREIYVNETGVHDTFGVCCRTSPKECARLYEIYHNEDGVSVIAQADGIVEMERDSGISVEDYIDDEMRPQLNFCNTGRERELDPI